MKKLDRTGEKYITNEGYTVEIIEYINASNCSVRFNSDYIVKNICYCQVFRGNIRNPYHLSVCDIGYLGEGRHTVKINGKITKKYLKWNSMINRCYNERDLKKRPNYLNCTVDKRWHNFQVFGDWFEENYNSEYMDSWQLDKDILVKGNKIYSPENCVFVPLEINLFFSKRYSKKISDSKVFQDYKIEKDEIIKKMADKWKYLIDPRIYDIMRKWKIKDR